MKYYALLGLLSCWPLLSRAQADEAGILAARRVEGGYHDSAYCRSLMRDAQRLAAKDSLVLADYHDFESDTHRALLQRVYHIAFLYPTKGDVIHPDNECFNRWMEACLKARYGPSFFQCVVAEADSLDRLGLGFQSATVAGSVPKQAFEAQYKYSREFAGKAGHYLSATFTITATGRATNIKARRTSTGGGPYFELSIAPPDSLCVEAEALIRRMHFVPARFRGQAVASEAFVWLAPYD
jgi:hypothetical protein